MLAEPFERDGCGTPFGLERTVDADHGLQRVQPLTDQMRQPHQDAPVGDLGQHREALGRRGLRPYEGIHAGATPFVHTRGRLLERLGRQIGRGDGREGVHLPGLACTGLETV
jgi:hypothetical protein